MKLYLRVKEMYFYIITQIFLSRFFGEIGKKSRLISPERIVGAEKIFIKDYVTIHEQVYLMTVQKKEISGIIEIKSRCQIGARNHIVSANRIIIERNVLTASNVYITDNSHGYEDITKPIFNQPLSVSSSIKIGENTWLGENVCIIKSNVGKNCVIGANSVVTHDIPDYCVAVGCPAKIIKRYDVVKGVWLNEKF